MHSNNHNSSSFVSNKNNNLKEKIMKRSSMIYLCRFHQRNRLIEIPITSEDYYQQNRITHAHLKHLIIEEFQLQQIIKTTLIIQLWNEQYQEYIDIESFKQIPFEGRLQVLIEKDLHSNDDSSHPINIKIEKIDDQSLDNVIYDLLPKPIDGIPIPRFPPHIVAFLNGNGDANQLNALVQSLYQEIVKYELYPNTDELRSIISRLIDRYPYCTSMIGSIELLVRKLYYKFCNERKKYPVELKRRQSNKRKRLIRGDDFQGNFSNDFHRLIHFWTTNLNHQESNSSSPISNNQEKSHPLNLSISTNE